MFPESPYMGQIKSKSAKEAINLWRKKIIILPPDENLYAFHFLSAQNTLESGEMQIWEDYEESK